MDPRQHLTSSLKTYCTKGGVAARHCSVLLRKHVLPRLFSPEAGPTCFAHVSNGSASKRAIQLRAGGNTRSCVAHNDDEVLFSAFQNMCVGSYDAMLTQSLTYLTLLVAHGCCERATTGFCLFEDHSVRAGTSEDAFGNHNEYLVHRRHSRIIRYGVLASVSHLLSGGAPCIPRCMHVSCWVSRSL